MLIDPEVPFQIGAEVLRSGHWEDPMIEEHAMHQLCSLICGTAAAQSVSAGNGANCQSDIGVLCTSCFFSMHLNSTVPGNLYCVFNSIQACRSGHCHEREREQRDRGRAREPLHHFQPYLALICLASRARINVHVHTFFDKIRNHTSVV